MATAKRAPRAKKASPEGVEPSKASAPEGVVEGCYKVRSRREIGRWRAGKHWSRDWSGAHLDAAQLAAVQADEMLEVKPVLEAEYDDLIPVEDRQPRPAPEPGSEEAPEPEPFEDPKLRRRQEKLLKEQDKELKKAKKAEAEAADAERAEAERNDDGPPPDAIV